MDGYNCGSTINLIFTTSIGFAISAPRVPIDHYLHMSKIKMNIKMEHTCNQSCTYFAGNVIARIIASTMIKNNIEVISDRDIKSCTWATVQHFSNHACTQTRLPQS